MTAIPKPKNLVPRPRLSDRNLARFVRMPASRQMRFLHDQKYPRGEPQVFMQPYYARGLACIRDVMKRGFPGIIDARGKLESIGQASKRANNQRVFEAYVGSPHARRRLMVVTSHRYQAYARTMEIKFSPHIVAEEEGEPRFIYFHEKGAQCDPEQARLTLEFGQWVLAQNGVHFEPHQFELIDLFGGMHFRGQPIRPSTVQLIDDMARHIQGQWPTIDP